ncbi:MAG: Sua5/YciO/YrdC/YwlC family protein, partial [Candidatus Riflebacteria bacterium]|nr:Sua5/YciO/YrdC/YwlC family protein [Candidatus Riflebacteria bacterium]
MKRIKIHDLLEDKSSLNQFCNDMKNGAVAVIPTDTLYVFAVSFNSKEAVEKVYRIKNRDARKPLILFVTKVEELNNLGLNTSQENQLIINNNWPGALTAVLTKPSTGELSSFNYPTIGVRAPA